MEDLNKDQELLVLREKVSVLEEELKKKEEEKEELRREHEEADALLLKLSQLTEQSADQSGRISAEQKRLEGELQRSAGKIHCPIRGEQGQESGKKKGGERGKEKTAKEEKELKKEKKEGKRK